MKVESVHCPVMGVRKKYTLDENDSELVDFKPGIEVLPAMYHESTNQGNYYYVKLQEMKLLINYKCKNTTKRKTLSIQQQVEWLGRKIFN